MEERIERCKDERKEKEKEEWEERIERCKNERKEKEKEELKKG